MAEVTTIYITVDDVNIHCQIEGTVQDMFTGLLMAIRQAAVNCWKAKPSELAYEKLIHEFQRCVAPTSPIWDISKELPDAAPAGEEAVSSDLSGKIPAEAS